MEAGEIAGRTLLDNTDRPTAIFAVNDNTAIGVMAAAHARGLRIPEDLSLVGYNDVPVVSRLPVPLTTVRVPFRQIATGALELLNEASAGAPPRTLIAAPTLIPASRQPRGNDVRRPRRTGSAPPMPGAWRRARARSQRQSDIRSCGGESSGTGDRDDDDGQREQADEKCGRNR